MEEKETIHKASVRARWRTKYICYIKSQLYDNMQDLVCMPNHPGKKMWSLIHDLSKFLN